MRKTIVLIILVTLAGCKNDDVTPKPTISDLEVGYENNKTGYIGKDMHLEAEIVAEGGINKIVAKLEKEDGAGDDITAEITGQTGNKNAHIHTHVEIPSDAKEGEYHFSLSVTDQKGQETVTETHVDIKPYNGEDLGD